MTSGLNHILVTGGAGFIGSHTVDLLLQEGKQVTVLDNLFTGKLTNLNMQHPDLTFVEGDVLEYPYLAELVNKVDAILHLAAVASVPLSIEDPIYSFQVNAQGFVHVLEAVRKADRHVRLVYASSAAVYGDTKALPCRDDVALTAHALSPYALQKIQNEEYASLYQKLFNVKSLGLRYFNVYGERQDPDSPYSGVISRFLAANEKGEPYHVFGDGSQSRDFIHVSDIAFANLRALQHEMHGVMNIGTGTPENLLQLIDYIEESSPKGNDIKFLPKREGDIHDSYAEMTKTHSELQFKAQISLQTGIEKMLKK